MITLPEPPRLVPPTTRVKTAYLVAEQADSVVTPWLRQGHATRMLAEGLQRARTLGLDRVLLTCAVDNVASKRVILANGGRAEGRRGGEDRFWIDL